MKKELVRPTADEIDREIERRRYWRRYRRAFRGALYSLAVISAIAVLVVTLWMPVLQITGSSMEPTLQNNQLVVCVKTEKFEPGDVIAFYYNNKILIKRVIATSGQYVDIQEDGTVLVDGVALDEPYIREKSKGECDISLPYQVADGRIFVMGDDRALSIDSRTTAVGTISHEEVLGRVLFKAWPLSRIGKVK